MAQEINLDFKYRRFYLYAKLGGFGYLLQQYNIINCNKRNAFCAEWNNIITVLSLEST